MTREEALKKVRQMSLPKETMEILEALAPELAESEDERIMKALIEVFKKKLERGFKWVEYGIPNHSVLDWLEKQKENIEKEYVFRPLAGTDITIAAEQAIRRANEGDHLVLAFNGAYIPVRKGCNANKIVDIYDAFIKKQKEASKAIEAVDRIDNYIDENVANAHDMKDSNPDKKYCQGIDDTLAGIAWILQDVYSNEKQKEQKPAETTEDNETEIQVAFREGKSAGRKEVFEHPEEYGLVEQKPAEWKLPNDFEEAVYKVANFISPFDSQDELRKVSHRFAEQLLSLAKKELGKPAEWSEEDEDNLHRVIRSLEDNDSDWKELSDWLKSLRKCPKPSDRWKHSEEHLSALLAVFNDPNNIGSQTCQLALTDLYEQLKKL